MAEAQRTSLQMATLFQSVDSLFRGLTSSKRVSAAADALRGIISHKVYGVLQVLFLLKKKGSI